MTPSGRWTSTRDTAPAASGDGWTSTQGEAQAAQLRKNDEMIAAATRGKQPGGPLEFAQGLVVTPAKGAWEMGKRIAAGPESTGELVRDIVQGTGQAHVEMARRAGDAWKQGRYSEALGYSLAAALPLLGPAAASSAEKIGSGQVAEGLGEATSLVAGLPTPARALAAPVRAAAVRVAPAVQRSALSGGYTVRAAPETVQGAAQTMLESKIPFAETGLTRIGAELRKLQQEKMALTGAGAQAGKTISRQALIDDLVKLRGKVAKQINPAEDIRQVDAIINDIRNRHPANIPVDLAEALKEGTYSQTKWGKGAPPHLAATELAEKTAALNLKNQLEQAIPELTGINPRQQNLLDLKPILETALRKYRHQGKFMGRLGKEMITPGVEIGGGLLGWAASHDALGAAAGGLAADILKTVLTDPKVKTALAIKINQAQRFNPGKWGAPSMAAATARVNEYRDSLNSPRN